MVKALVWSVALYGSETWTLRKDNVKRIQAFEMWIWRKMEKNSWTAHVSNKEILSLVQEQRSLIHVIKQRQANGIGHVLGHEDCTRLYCVSEDCTRGEDRRKTDTRKTKKEDVGSGESWTAHVSNEEILSLVQEQRSLVHVIKQRQA